MPPNTSIANNNNPMSSAWFAGAPFAKLLTLVTVATFIVVQSKNVHNAMTMNPARMLSQAEWYRLVSSKLTFATTGDLVTGTLLLAYLTRKWERELGTRKFVLFCVFVNAVVMLMEFLFYTNATSLSLWLQTTTSTYAGPYPLLGACMMLFYKYTPRLYPRFVGILGLHFSEKALYYLWFAYVVFGGGGGLRRPSSSSSHNMTALIATAGGVVAAQVYTYSSLLQTCQVPPCPWLSRLSDRLLEAPPRIFFPQMTAAGGFGGRQQQQQQQQRGAGRPRPVHPIFGQQHQQQPLRPNAVAPRPTAPPAPAPVTPDPTAVEQLTLMGFDRTAVEQALRQTNNNVERAADQLLSQQ